MKTHISVVLGLLILQQNLSRANRAFICNSLSDSIMNRIPAANNQERLKALEEKITQLQKIIATALENSTSLNKESVPQDCAEIYDRGVRSDGVYIISPDGKCPFRVYCDMANGGWTVIQRRQDSGVSFYRPWDEYVKGFGDIDGDHWLGLDKIHRLSKAGSQIYFHMETYDGSFEYEHYTAFTVHDVTTAYKMNVDAFGYEGTLKNRLSYHNDMKFSTYDRDNDKSGGNCCLSHDGGGWWWNSCYLLNPNGIYGKETKGGVSYYDGRVFPIKNMVIKVKKRNGLC